MAPLKNRNKRLINDNTEFLVVGDKYRAAIPESIVTFAVSKK
jgi:hypothetical protein